MSRYTYPYNVGADERYKADNVCLPVSVDAEGRTRPVIVRTTNQSTAQMAYVARVERTTEHVRIRPLVADYTYDSPVPKVQQSQKNYKDIYNSPPNYVEPMKSNYGYRHISPPKYVEPVKPNYGYRHISPPKYVEPMKPNYGYRYISPPKYVEPEKSNYGYKHSSPPNFLEDGYWSGSPQDDQEPEDSIHSYRSSSQPKVEPVKNYGYYKPQPVEYRYKAEPVKDSGYEVDPGKGSKYADDKWGRPLSPARDRPPEVEDLLDKVQTEASQPKKLGSLVVPSRGQVPQSNVQNGINPGYGGYSDYSNNYLQKPSGNNTINPKEDYDKYRKNDPPVEPTSMTYNGGWARPGPTNGAATLRNPTSDIATAVQNLKEAVMGLSVTNNAHPPPRYTVPISTETIDSREAARRYGNIKLPSRSPTTDDTNTLTIDSREAAKKYGGANIA